jgi:hypothetical protein
MLIDATIQGVQQQSCTLHTDAMLIAGQQFPFSPKERSLTHHEPRSSEGTIVYGPKPSTDSETWDNDTNVMKMTCVDSMTVDHLKAMNDKTSVLCEYGDLLSKKSNKTYVLSKPRPSEVPGTVDQWATKQSQTLSGNLEEMMMTKRSCGCEISETVMMASWPYVVETSENIASVGDVDISNPSSFVYSEYISDYEYFYNPDSNCILNSISDHTTSSRAEMDDKTSRATTENEDAECEYSIRVPTPETCIDVDIFDEKVILIED